MISLQHANIILSKEDALREPKIVRLRSKLVTELHDAQRHVTGGNKIIILRVDSIPLPADEAPRLMLTMSSDYSHELRDTQVVFLQHAGMLGVRINGHDIPPSVMAISGEDYFDACIARGAMVDSLIDELDKLVKQLRKLPR